MVVLILASAIAMFTLAIVASGISLLIAKDYVHALLNKRIGRMLPNLAVSDQQPAALIFTNRIATQRESRMPPLTDLYVS